ncbi:MAG: hypothetical protein JWR80_9165 [Bradyrhizobium sp.]|nr:hypothetical protein [Bradyrhizobium sp.]
MPAETTVNTSAFARVPNSAAAARLDHAAGAKPPVGMVAPSPGGSAPLLYGPKMRPRDEAVFWLSAAAEIEHALMVQYLFAAYTIDPESTPNNAKADATRIKNSLLQIAREEMGHFITVQNLLQIVGGPLHFGRQYSPFEAVIQPFRYRLEPLTLDSLAKYVIAECPNRPFSELVLRPDPAQDAALKQKLADDIEPRAIRSNGDVALWHVGALFKRLSELFKSELADDDLRTDRGGLQAMWTDWGYEAPRGTDGKIVLVEALTAKTASALRSEAVAAIAKIGEQGEGFDAEIADGDESHFERFLGLYEKLEQVEGALGRPLALPVAANPNTTPAPARTNNIMLGMGQDHLEAGRISNERTLRWAHLFNLRYRILLGCLHHALLHDTPAYTLDGPQKGDRTPKGLLQWWTFSEMRRLKTIAEKLRELPAGDSAGPRAGAPFELPYSLRMPHVDTDRWAVHADVFAMAKAFIDEKMLVAGETGSDFLNSVAQADAQSAAMAVALSRAAPLPAGAHATDFRKFARILDEAVRGFAFGSSPHGAFWRDATRAAVVGTGLIAPGDPDGSPVVERITLPQSDTKGMPRERPRIAGERVEFVRDWIARGAPDNVPGGEVGVAAEPAPPREPPAAPPPPPPAVLLSFAQDIKPLFRDKDRSRMLFRFDLFLFDDVKQNAPDILDAVSSGRMPCDVPWDSSKVATFQKWIDDGLLP